MSQATKISDLKPINSEKSIINLARHIKKVEPKNIDLTFFNSQTNQWETYFISLDQFHNLALGL